MKTYVGKSVNGIPFDATGNVNVAGINTAFVDIPYTATMSVAYDASQPNFQINVTGNLDLTITGTTNGNFGLVNLYFSGTEVATLNGLTTLIITGAGAMIPCSFEHDINGLRWYSEVNTSLFALQDGTILYSIKYAKNNGTITNVGNVVTGIGTTFDSPIPVVGAKLVKSNGETAIVATVTDATNLTTLQPFTTDSTDSYELFNKAFEINSDGFVILYDWEEGGRKIEVRDDRSVKVGGMVLNRGNYAATVEEIHIRSSIPDLIYDITTINPSPSDVGTTVTVNDASSPTYGGIYVGGGSVLVDVKWDGTNWIFR